MTENSHEKQENPGDRVFTLLDQLEQAIDQLIEQLKTRRLNGGEQTKEAAK